jgi:hypothetical protein
VLEYTVWESLALAKYYEHIQHEYPMVLSLTYRLQALEQSQLVHLQRARQLVAKIQAREMA